MIKQIEYPNSVVKDNLCFYVDKEENSKLSQYISNNYDQISRTFKTRELELVFLPRLGETLGDELVSYFAGSNNTKLDSKPEHFYGVLPENVVDQLDLPCIFHYNSRKHCFELSIPEDKAINDPFQFIFSTGLHFNQHPAVQERKLDNKVPEEACLACYEPTVRFSLKESAKERRYVLEEIEEEDSIDKENERLISKIHGLMNKLRMRGLTEQQLRSLLLPSVTISQLEITDGFHFILSDYDHKEVKMTPLQKALYILYLQHEEGISFKNLIDYQEELFSIYKKVDGGWNPLRQRKTIENVCNPLRNTINENVSRIRNAFRAVVDDSIAQNYYIQGHQGEAMTIKLDRKLVKM